MVMAALGTGEIVLIVIAALVLAFLAVLALNYKKVGPNQVLIVSGGFRKRVREPDGTVRKVGYKMTIGGGAFVLPLFQTAEVLTLEISTVQVKADDALTKGGVQVNAVGLAQVKVGSTEAEIRRAAEQFLGRGVDAIRDAAHPVLEGLLRAFLGSASVEEIYQNRDEFNSRLMREAIDDFGKMGLELVSFTLIDLSDTQGYLEALGMPQIAAVKRDSEVAQAETDKEAAIKTAEARKAGDIAKLKAETEVAEASRDFEIARAEYAAEVNQKKAAADMSYDLERQKSNQQLKAEEIQVRIVERTKMIELESLEIDRKEKELQATVQKTAEARRQQVELESEAEAYRLEAEAKGHAAAARLAAEADSEAIRLRGNAEAEAMKQKADAYQEYNEAAVYQMLVEKLPELARAVSEPLSKLDKIVIVDSGGDGKGVAKVTGQVAHVLAQLPEVVESLGGVDLKELAKRLAKSGDDKGSAKDEGD
ncbi:MAG: flotillin family protein [Planctomycetota bacterium]|jgi:flotillin